MPTGDDGFWVEFAALWETREPDKRGNPRFSGKTGKGEQYVMLVEVAPKAKSGPADVGTDVPF